MDGCLDLEEFGEIAAAYPKIIQYFQIPEHEHKKRRFRIQFWKESDSIPRNCHLVLYSSSWDDKERVTYTPNNSDTSFIERLLNRNKEKKGEDISKKGEDFGKKGDNSTPCSSPTNAELSKNGMKESEKRVIVCNSDTETSCPPLSIDQISFTDPFASAESDLFDFQMLHNLTDPNSDPHQSKSALNELNARATADAKNLKDASSPLLGRHNDSVNGCVRLCQNCILS
jgi:hypothetical protein